MGSSSAAAAAANPGGGGASSGGGAVATLQGLLSNPTGLLGLIEGILGAPGGCPGLGANLTPATLCALLTTLNSALGVQTGPLAQVCTAIGGLVNPTDILNALCNLPILSGAAQTIVGLLFPSAVCPNASSGSALNVVSTVESVVSGVVSLVNGKPFIFNLEMAKI